MKDKALYEVTITKTSSSGVLLNSLDDVCGIRESHWHQAYVGNIRIVKDNTQKLECKLIFVCGHLINGIELLKDLTKTEQYTLLHVIANFDWEHAWTFTTSFRA